MCYFCQYPRIFYFLLAAIFSQGKSTQWHGGIQLLPLTQALYKLPRLTPLKSCTPFPRVAAELLTCHCNAKYFNCCIFHFPLPPIQACGEYFRGPLLCTALQNHTLNYCYFNEMYESKALNCINPAILMIPKTVLDAVQAVKKYLLKKESNEKRRRNTPDILITFPGYTVRHLHSPDSTWGSDS